MKDRKLHPGLSSGVAAGDNRFSGVVGGDVRRVFVVRSPVSAGRWGVNPYQGMVQRFGVRFGAVFGRTVAMARGRPSTRFPRSGQVGCECQAVLWGGARASSLRTCSRILRIT
jgi:hypothetical protein